MNTVFNQFGIKNEFDTKSRVFTLWPEDLSKDDEKRFLDTLTKTIETCQRASTISKEMKLFAEYLETLGLRCKIQSIPQKEIPFFTHTLIFKNTKIQALSPELLATTVIRGSGDGKALLHVFDTFDPNPADHAGM